MTLTFSHRGKQYRVTRNPKYDRPKLKGEGMTTELEGGELYEEEALLASGSTQVTERVTELLGLDYRQFRQISMIAQGEFQQLLVSSSKERTQIFRDIFQTRIYDTMAALLSSRVKALNGRIDEVKHRADEITGTFQMCIRDSPYIVQKYNAKNFRKEKIKNKRALQEELGLPQDDRKFMVGIVSRLTDQKGLDLIQCVLDEICQDDIQLVVLGTGEERYENMFRHYDWKYNDKVSANIFYSEPMSHKIYAACDAFLMPSLFEPCGLSQLMSLRYGTVPIVRETGGLKDTVEPYNEFESRGTGFSFQNYNAHEMLAVIRYAERIYYDKKREWNKIIDRAMAMDYSWNTSAVKYQELYDWLIGY